MQVQLYAITDRLLLPPHPGSWEAALCAQVEKWVEADVEWVQLREKNLPESTLAALVRRLAAITRRPGTRTRLLVNGLSPGPAAESGADGVHLPSGALPEGVRAAVQVAGVVTISCHTLPEVAAARKLGASAVLWAPVFGKVVNGNLVQSGAGLPALHAACVAASSLPVFALGGVTVANAPACVEAGASGVAGIRLFQGELWRSLR